jgi:CheY-like chemotaxis protein
LIVDVEPSEKQIETGPMKNLQSLMDDSTYAHLRDVRILLVAKAFLKPLTSHVTEALNGVAALECLETGTFDLILMDVRMPEMDGFEATTRIRNSHEPWRSLPIIALTANASAEDAQRCRAAGMDAHIAKPLSINELYDSLKMALEPGADSTKADQR